MKKYIIFGICLFITIIILVMTNIFNYKTEIKSISSFYYSTSGGMDPNSYKRYEYKDGRITYENGYNSNVAKNRKVDKMFEEKLITILKEENIIKWNGFNKNDKDVLDGSGFNLDIKYNDNEYIKASGYMIYPKNYKSFNKKIVELFNSYTY